MELRTHIWGMAYTGVGIVIVALLAVLWLRPLPNRAADRLAEVEATWAAHVEGTESAAATAAVLAKLAAAKPGPGERSAVDASGRDAYDQVRREAIARLGSIDHPTAFAALCRLAVSPDRYTCLYAVEALRRKKTREALPALFAALEHDDQVQQREGTPFARVTLETLRAIREVADSNALAQLRQFVDSGKRSFDQDIRRTIHLITEDLANPEVIARDTGIDLIDQLLDPQAGRLDVPSQLLSPGLSPLTGESLAPHSPSGAGHVKP